MSDFVAIALLLIFGPGLLAYGVWILRTRAWTDSVPALELLIDRAAGIDPPSRNIWDRRFARFQAWFMTIFGALVSLGGAAIFIADVIL